MANAEDVYPPRNLPGRADNWGRRVEDVDKSLWKNLRQLSQTVRNGLRAVSGQLSVLAKQIDRISSAQNDLVGRVSHQRIADNSPASLGNYPLGESTIPDTEFRFTLDTPRTVQITQFSMASTTSPPMRVGIVLNGVRVFNTSSSSTTYIGDYGTPQTGAVHFSGLFQLPAGSHAISAAVLVSGSTAAVNTVYSVYTVVNVLQQTV